jgi:hypothetical protein
MPVGQAELDTAAAELAATADGAAAKEGLAGAVATKQLAMDGMLAKFKVHLTPIVPSGSILQLSTPQDMDCSRQRAWSLRS